MIFIENLRIITLVQTAFSNSIILDLKKRLSLNLDSFSGEAFFPLHNGGAFFSSFVLAHHRCAHSFSASQLGELVLIED